MLTIILEDNASKTINFLNRIRTTIKYNDNNNYY